MATQTSFVDATIPGIQPPHYQLPAAAHVGAVSLAVSSLQRSLAFYRDIIGLAVLSQQADAAELGVDGNVLLRLREMPGVQSIQSRSRLGLYHTAFLLPSRAALGSFVQHLTTLGVYFGAGDHLYSEALYLVDPDGLSVEVYADRDRSTWKTRGQELLSATEPVDLGAVLATATGPWQGAPSGTTVGHVHLYIGDLANAVRFYHEGLGFAVMTWSYPGALFLSAGGYHHHVGLNTWAAASPPASATDARLLAWELVVPNAADLGKLESNLQKLGWNTTRGTGSLQATDPWGITVHILIG